MRAWVRRPAAGRLADLLACKSADFVKPWNAKLRINLLKKQGILPYARLQEILPVTGKLKVFDRRAVQR